MPKRRIAIATALLVSATSLTAVAASSANATSAAILHVDNGSPSCTDAGVGSVSAPFCTIQAAANVVGPGQTVLIGNSDFRGPYTQSVVVKHSGTASAPITFQAADRYFIDSTDAAAFNLTNVSDVVVSGLFADSLQEAVVVSHSSDITIENSKLWENGVPVPSPLPVATVHVTDHSSAVTVEKSWFNGRSQDAVLVDGGSTGTVVATNIFAVNRVAAGIVVSGASGTAVTGNSIDGGKGCITGISVTSNSTGTSVENNAVSNLATYYSASCPGSTAVDLSVSADSAATTSAKYNVLDDVLGVVPYNWAGTAYTSVGAFHSATGQGAQDAVPDGLATSILAMPTSSPLIDSADANAPGETSTDIYGNARVDDPSIPNTGTGVGYYDRGAVEYQEFTSSNMVVNMDTAQYVEAHVRLAGIPWGSWPTVTFDWGDGTTSKYPVTSGTVNDDFTDTYLGQHLYSMRGTYTVTATLTDATGSKTMTQAVTTTADTYAPVAPTRVLDTRHGIGTGGATTPVAANTSVVFDPAAGVGGAPAPHLITAVVLNVTVTAPTQGGYITAYPDGTARPQASNLNFSPGETVPNLVTVKLGADRKVALFNGSAGTAHLVADVAGYYIASAAGDGYVPAGPARLLDTRNGTGTGGSTKPVPANGILNLKIDGDGPVAASGVTAVALNVTVTRPAAGGHITVYPGGTVQPTASNLNFSAGETVGNMVIVPVGADGTVNLANGSAGTTALVADVFGYYITTGTGGHAFVPTDPVRLVDTRSGPPYPAPPIPPNGNVILQPQTDAYFHTVLVLNVTATQPTSSGYITAYTQNTPLPPVSNVNFSAGQTVPNLVISPAADLGLETLLRNNSAGTVHLIVDMFGYFS